MNEETATNFRFESITYENLPKLLEYVYCPEDWMGFGKISKTKHDLEMIAFAVSLLISDFKRENLVLQKLYEVWSNSTDSVGKTSDYILQAITPNALQTRENFNNYCISSIDDAQ